MDFGIGFQVTGLSTVEFTSFSEDAFLQPQALARFYVIDQLAVRLRFGINSGSSSDEFSITYLDSMRQPDPFTVDSATLSTASQSIFSFAPGAEYHFQTDNKVDPYVGIEIPIAIKSQENLETDREYRWTNTVGVPILQQDLNIKQDTDGGFSIGVNLLAGFNYFFSEHIAIGAEYGIGFLNTSDGGTVRVATTGTQISTADVADVTVINDTETFQQSSSTSGFRTNTKGGINLSLFF
jgi:hypothetical protein